MLQHNGDVLFSGGDACTGDLGMWARYRLLEAAETLRRYRGVFLEVSVSSAVAHSDLLSQIRGFTEKGLMEVDPCV